MKDTITSFTLSHDPNIYLQNPVSSHQSLLSHFHQIMQYFEFYVAVPSVAITMIIAGFLILRGKRIYTKTGNRSNLNFGLVWTLYAMAGSGIICFEIEYNETIRPWLTMHGQTNLSETMIGIIIVGIMIVISYRFIKKQEQKIYSRV